MLTCVHCNTHISLQRNYSNKFSTMDAEIRTPVGCCNGNRTNVQGFEPFCLLTILCWMVLVSTCAYRNALIISRSPNLLLLYYPAPALYTGHCGDKGHVSQCNVWGERLRGAKESLFRNPLGGTQIADLAMLIRVEKTQRLLAPDSLHTTQNRLQVSLLQVQEVVRS